MNIHGSGVKCGVVASLGLTRHRLTGWVLLINLWISHTPHHERVTYSLSSSRESNRGGGFIYLVQIWIHQGSTERCKIFGNARKFWDPPPPASRPDHDGKEKAQNPLYFLSSHDYTLFVSEWAIHPSNHDHAPSLRQHPAAIKTQVSHQPTKTNDFVQMLYPPSEENTVLLSILSELGFFSRNKKQQQRSR